jgi:hypothetical protein
MLDIVKNMPRDICSVVRKHSGDKWKTAWSGKTGEIHNPYGCGNFQKEGHIKGLGNFPDIRDKLWK